MSGIPVDVPVGSTAGLAVPAAVLAVLLVVAGFLAHQHRRYGRFGGWSGQVGTAVPATGCGLAGYAVWPLPAGTVCAAGAAAPVGGIGRTVLPPDPDTLLRAAVIAAVFLPVGLLARHRYRSGWVRAIALGLALAAVVEVVQYSGVFGLAPCAYRVAALDDVLLAGLGTLLGWSAARLPERWLPRGWPAAVPDLLPPGGYRRLLGHTLDVALCWSGGALLAAMSSAVGLIPEADAEALRPAMFGGLLVAVGVLVPLLRRDRCTPGRAAVHLALSDSGPPRPAARRRVLARALPCYLPAAALVALGQVWWALLLPAAHACCALVRPDRAGLLDLLAGTRVVTRTMVAGGGLPAAQVRHVPPRPPADPGAPEAAGRG
ncbi:VanZ family protein [Marinactinospora rubrisoli]|uniref:VanZ family protein n=1 Tax=Marinactinospora rubrisoli TaxID=2715399 RepID=A0ABW2KEF5_9ACTN